MDDAPIVCGKGYSEWWHSIRYTHIPRWCLIIYSNFFKWQSIYGYFTVIGNRGYLFSISFLLLAETCITTGHVNFSYHKIIRIFLNVAPTTFKTLNAILSTQFQAFAVPYILVLFCLQLLPPYLTSKAFYPAKKSLIVLNQTQIVIAYLPTH